MVTGLTSMMGPSTGKDFGIKNDRKLEKAVGSPADKSDEFFAKTLDAKSVQPKKIDPRMGSPSEADKTKQLPKNLATNKVEPKESKTEERKPSADRADKENSNKEVSKETSSEGKGLKTKESTNGKDSKVVKEVADKNQTEREKVMLKFMDSFESEFGVPREKMVEAMTELPNSELAEKPEVTAQGVIANLDLPTEKQEEALSMYLAMLGTLKLLSDPNAAKSMGQQLMQPMATSLPDSIGKNISKESLTQFQSPNGSQSGWVSSKERQKMINQSLDNMNKKFFLQENQQQFGFHKQEGMSNFGANTNNQLSNDLLRSTNVKSELGTIPSNNGMTAADLPPDLLAMDPDYAMNPMNANGAIHSQAIADSGMSVEEEQEFAKKLAVLMGAVGALEGISASGKKDMKIQSANSKNGLEAYANANQMNINDLQFANGNMVTGDANAFAQSGSFSDSGLDDGSDSQSDTSGKSSTAAGLGALAGGAMLGSDQFKVDSAAAGVNGNPAITPTKGQNEQNMQAIMKQAQYLIKRGGGEAKVQMNPDGLGPVHLRVVVEEGGKLNVELSTKTKEAKLAIEDSLGDLRSKLHEHKYSVESIKVDVGGDLRSEMNQRDSHKMQDGFKNLTDFRNQQQEQEQARQFLQQFHQENLFKRDTAWDIDNPNGYRPAVKELAPLKPASGQAAAKRYQGISKGQGLDLVA